MNKLTISKTRSAAIGWPALDAAVEVPSEDGPLALARAVVAAAVRHKFRLAAWIGACVALAAFYAHSIPPSYTATATLLLEPRRPPAAAGQDATLAPLLDLNRAESELQVIRSERLLAKVFESLELAKLPELQPQTPGTLARLRGFVETMLGLSSGRPQTAEEAGQIAFFNFVERVGVRRVGQSYVVEVSYKSSDPTLARRVANATVSAYLWQSVALKFEAARNGAEFIQARVNSLSAQTKAAAAAIVAGALPDSATPDADARVIGAALQPFSPSAPRTKLIIALGGIIGLVSGLFTATFGHVLDHRIRTPEDLTRAVGLPCLATVPDVSRRSGLWPRPDAELNVLASFRSDSSFAAAMRDLRTSIMLACRSERPEGNHTVALVSSEPKSGCTLLCINLARIMRSGGYVTLIDADVHRAGNGLTEQVPKAAVSLTDAITSGTRVDESTFMDLDGIALLPARVRGTGANHLAYLGAPELPQIIEYARNWSDVLLDLPPLSAAADTKAAALCVDAVVIVVVAGRTTKDEAVAAIRALKEAGANVIGAVLNRANS